MEGNVTESSVSVIEIENIDFSEIRKIRSTAIFNTSNQTDFVRIKNNYTMDITLSAKFSKALGK